MSSLDPWSFRAAEKRQRHDIRELSLWQRLLLHDELLANAAMIAGQRLHEHTGGQRHLHHVLRDETFAPHSH